MTTLTPETIIETEREHIPLSDIGPNPYQTRLTDDPAHIQALAEDILVNGLLQVPLARPDQVLNSFYQLAFGHSRLAAYKLLVEQGHAQFATMPVDVRPLTDRQMSDMAAAENAKRKNLSAIETATALQARIERFHLTQAEAGAPFGLGQSAVANLLRLLKLPKSVQDQVHSGELPERLARQMATLAAAAPKQIERMAKVVAAAPAAERDDAMAQELEQLMEDHGRDMRQAAFETDWPLIPIAVDAPKDGEPTMLVACLSCQYFYKRDRESFCVNPPCWDLKQARRLQECLDAAVAKTGLPAANGEKSHPVAAKYNYPHERLVPDLVKAGRLDTNLGLRVTVSDEQRGYFENITGHTQIHVVTIKPAAVKTWMEESAKKRDQGNGSGKAVKVAPAKAPAVKNETPAQKAKREAQEAAAKALADKEAAARRSERVAVNKADADVVWMIQNYAEIVGSQLTIGGAILEYAIARWRPKNVLGKAGEFHGLKEWYAELQERADGAEGKITDELLRQVLVAAEIFDRILPWNGPRVDTFGEMVDKLAELAEDGNVGYGADNMVGFQAKLPVGWNKPPVHHTAGNCWRCGQFGSQWGRITKAELESGWTVALSGDQVTNVTCSDCKGKPAPKAAAAKPTAKKKSK